MPTTPQAGPAPIKHWGLRRFKSVESADLGLSPLTVIVGANSSGKSSVLQSILLLAQAAQEGAASPAGRFRLNGELVQLGTYDLIRTFDASDDSFVVEAELELDLDVHGPQLRAPLNRVAARRGGRPDRVIHLHWRGTFSGHPEREPGSVLWRELDVRLAEQGGAAPSAALHLTRRTRSSDDAAALERGITLTSLVIRGWEPRWPAADAGIPLSAFLACDGSLQDGSVDRGVHGVYAPGGLPTYVLVEEDYYALVASAWAGLFVAEASESRGRQRDDVSAREAGEAQRRMDRVAAHAAADLLRNLPQIGGHLEEMLQQSVAGALERPEWRSLAGYIPSGELERRVANELGSGPSALVPRHLGGIAVAASAATRLLSEHLVYLGPIRDEPRLTYTNNPPAQITSFGRRGENTAAIFHQRKDEKILVPWPRQAPRTATLAEAVAAWMTEIVKSGSVDTEDQGRLGLELSVSPGSVALDLTRVGVGVSQVLPVVVACLSLPPNGVILLEQPELHLHPAAQQRLADFFIACATGGRQLIVETHSEYLVTRLRLRIAKDEGDEVRQLVTILNAELTNGHTTLAPVRMTRLGALEEWPEGFFDQTASDAEELMRAAYLKQSREATE